MVIGLGTRLYIRMYTRSENDVLRNGQQPGSAENSFFDHSKFEVMKSLSGLKLRAVMSINFVLKSTKVALHYLCLVIRLLGNYMSLADHKSAQRGRLGAYLSF